MKKAMALVLGVMLLGSGVMMHSAIAQQAAVQPVEVGNKICPVSGDKVGQMGDIVKHEYKGKIYNLCCGMCPKDFDKNPEKYAKIAEDEVAATAKAAAATK